MRIYEEFDFAVLNDPEFKEDAVREELISPLLAALGYSASGDHRVVRSRRLTHPFVYIGTTKHGVTIIPDYTLIVNEEHRWILDAKAPNEVLTSGKNPEQAFSYAIHPEIRASRYALCNGHSLVVFDTNKIEPTLSIKLEKAHEQWDAIRRLLSPIAFIKPELLNYKPDFGLYLLKTGATLQQKLYFVPLGIPMIAKFNDTQYTFTVQVGISGGLQRHLILMRCALHSFLECYLLTN